MKFIFTITIDLIFLSFIFFNMQVNGETVYKVNRDDDTHLNRTHNAKLVMLEDKCAPAKDCEPGLLLPVWEPQNNISLNVKLFRAFIYLMAMVYLFLGVSIVADRFMAAIEVITSQEREVKVYLPNNEETIILVQIWNKTVSNLTLMALGSSAPEILLSIIEICGNGFMAGDLGPGTIVGSAAFNFYVIIAICIVSIPSVEKRRIERIDVFWVTFIWSIFAYVWLYFILCIFSPNIIEVWEGLLTFAFFFGTVLTAYVVDRYTPALQRRIINANQRPMRQQISLRSSPCKDDNKKSIRLDDAADAKKVLLHPHMADIEIQAFQKDRQQFVQIFQDIRHKHPNMPLHEIGRLVAYKRFVDAPKSRAFRRMQATRHMTAGRSLFASNHFANTFNYELKKDFNNSKSVKQSAKEYSSNSNNVIFNFEPSHYICAEDAGHITLCVKCETKPSNLRIIGYVDYETLNGTAKAGEDYIHTHGTLIFQPNETTKEISVKIVDNDIYEFDEEFFVRLSRPRAVNADENQQIELKAGIGAAGEALVIIVDDDHAGQFSFRSQVECVSENQSVFHLPVNRQRGVRGKVIVPYTVVEGRAKKNEDFRCDDGQLVFHDHQNSATIRIEIINDDLYEKSEDFYIQLGQPIWHQPPAQVIAHAGTKDATMADGRPILGENSRCKIIIKEDEELKNVVDKIIKRANCSLAAGTSSWKQQFSEALNPSSNAGNDEENIENIDGAQEIKASFSEYLMHYISLPWKLAFAFIPPTDYLHGWVCFVVSIILIGALTALIGDVAALFGCTLGVKDSVTAITLVALGTSVPDTFASKLAAVQDKTADASIGNVTGSNAVNVFLGIGVAWAIAAVYHAFIVHDQFHVHAGSLANSLSLFLIGLVICVLVLQYRRYSGNIGAELGGPTGCKWISFTIFVGVWILYIIYSILDAYCVI